jgi:phosphoribosylanthranilate isomerase
MEAVTRPRVKICCIMSEVEAEIAVAHGANALGLVAAMPSGPGVISDAEIARIARRVPPGVASVLLTSRRDPVSIIAHQRATGTSVIQLVDTLTTGGHEDLRAALPGIRLVQVVHVTGEDDVEAAMRVAPHVDALLLDSGRPGLAVKELGGTGRRHDWTLSRRIRELSTIPVYLAGGLCAENAGCAIVEVGAFGLDVCSGVRTDGRLDPIKLAAFMTAAGIGPRQGFDPRQDFGPRPGFDPRQDV